MTRSTVIRHEYAVFHLEGRSVGTTYHGTDVDVDDYAIGIPTFDDRRYGSECRGGTRMVLARRARTDEHFFPFSLASQWGGLEQSMPDLLSEAKLMDENEVNVEPPAILGLGGV